MIVTCPSCSSKYRVRNDAVPADGARMRCPKCDTLFLAKPPAGPAANDSTNDDPSSMYQQLNPATLTGPQPIRAPQPPANTFVPPKPAAGPITSLFQAIDPASLPAEAQRPPPPQPAPAPAPSGLDTEARRVQTPAPTSPTVTVRPLEPPPPPRPPAGPAGMGAVVGSWVAVVVGALGAVSGLVFFLWATERANLDRALMPTFESSFGVQPPYSSLGKDAPSLDDLRRAAADTAAHGDLPGAVVLWQRVKAHDSADKSAAAAIAKLRADLGDQITEQDGTP